eukprot:97064-Pyramimonas_sp.AAC.1
MAKDRCSTVHVSTRLGKITNQRDLEGPPTATRGAIAVSVRTPTAAERIRLCREVCFAGPRARKLPAP